PTEAPTDQPTEPPTDAPTEAPTAERTEEKTEKSPVTDKPEEPEGGINPVIAIVIAIGAAAISATVAMLIIKSKRDKTKTFS
ncbi:MAG: hypothetical protein II135_02920, partial [Clostridia bacterium]|nr:hypothetical protein [Clostridia bacterium]